MTLLPTGAKQALGRHATGRARRAIGRVPSDYKLPVGQFAK